MRARMSMAKRQQEAHVKQQLQKIEREHKVRVMTDMAIRLQNSSQNVPITGPGPVVTEPTTGPYIIHRDDTAPYDPMDGLTTVNDILKYGVGYGAETAPSAGQLFVLNYYKEQVRSGRMSINARINGRALLKMIAAYNKLGKVAGYAGKLSRPATAVSILVDVDSYNRKQISWQRLTYKLGGTTTGVYLGLEVGASAGPAGAVLGALVGTSFDAGEWAYDRFIDPAFRAIAQWEHDFNNAINNGWIPGAR